MRPDIATSGASPKSMAPAGAIFAIATFVDENVDDRETVKVERREGLGQHVAKHARLPQRRSVWRSER